MSVGLRETSEGHHLVHSQRAGLSSSDSALFETSPTREQIAFDGTRWTSLDLETASYGSKGDSEDGATAPAWSQGEGTKGSVFFIQESGKFVAAKVQTTSHSGRRNSVDRPDAVGSEKRRSKRLRWKKLFPAGLMRRSGRTDRVGSKERMATRNVAVEVGEKWQEVSQFGLEALGIVAGRPSRRRGERELVVVKGLVPDSLADRTQQIAAGDQLVSVNDQLITNDTVTDILQGLSGAKELVFKSVRPKSTTSSVTLRRNLSTTSPALVRLLSGSPTLVWQSSMSSMPHALIYLSLNATGDTEDSQEAIVYQYPGKDCEWGWSQKIVALRGAFLTLSDLMKEVTGVCANTSTFEIDGRLVHIGYRQFQRDVLVLALPSDKVHIHSVTHFLDDITALLSLLYDSVPKAFSQSANVRRLDHMFSLVFERILSIGESGYLTRLSDTISGVPRLPLPADLLVKVSSCLSELESDDHSYMLDVLLLRRVYQVRGCCVYYKGYLLDSHLSDIDTQAVSLYCRYHCLLTVSQKQRVGQLVVWTEVCLPSEPAQSLVYQQLKGRTFLLIVGLGQTLLCVLLDCGGSTRKVRGHPGPDPLYVDLAQEVVMNLNTRGILDACETRIQSAPIPNIAQVDDFVGTQRPLSVFPGPSQSRTLTGRPRSVVFGKEVDGLSSSRDSSNWMTRISEQAGDLTTSVRVRAQTVAQTLTGDKKAMQPSQRPSLSLVPGGNGMVFHYMSVNNLSGIMVAPVQGAVIGGHLHVAVVRNFCKACISIRHVLVKQSEVSTSLPGVYEHGILMHCQHEGGQKQKTSLSYWVVGRLLKLPVQREFYVCFHETVPHNIVEMVFRLTLGAAT